MNPVCAERSAVVRGKEEEQGGDEPEVAGRAGSAREKHGRRASVRCSNARTRDSGKIDY